MIKFTIDQNRNRAPFKVGSYRLDGPHRIYKQYLKVPIATALDFQVAWASKSTSIVGPAGMSRD